MLPQAYPLFLPGEVKTDQFPFGAEGCEYECAVEVTTSVCSVKTAHQDCSIASDANGRSLQSEWREPLNRTLLWDETIFAQHFARRGCSYKRGISSRVQSCFVSLTVIVKPFFGRLGHALFARLVRTDGEGR
jgi:hypothetical protein